MSGVKRSHEEDDVVDIHPSRKQRLDLSDNKAELSKIFANLRDESTPVRLQATRDLLKTLASSSPGDLRAPFDYAITRLIKGVCSNAKAARSGFFIALIEVLRLSEKGSPKLSVTDVVDKMLALTETEGSVSGDEKRQHLIGRQYSLQAILQSGILENSSENDNAYVFDAVADLAAQKDWLRRECGHFMCEFLKSEEATEAHLRPLIESWATKRILKSPEGVAIWLTARKTFPQTKLPKGHWHHNNPLSSQERNGLTNILLKNAVQTEEESAQPSKKKASGTRQTTPSFAWAAILGYLYETDDGKEVASFWDDTVARPMFSSSSSTERKSLGLQIFAQTLKSAPAEALGDLVHANIIRCIVDQRAKADRYLHTAAKVPLDEMVKRAKSEPETAADMVTKLLEVIPPTIDKSTRSTVDALLASADQDGLVHIVKVTNDLCVAPGTDELDEADKKRRLWADALITLVRTRRSEPTVFFSKNETLSQWLKVLLRNLVDLSYQADISTSPPLSAASRSVFQERLVSTLGHLVNLPLQQAVVPANVVIDRLHQIRKSLGVELDNQAKSAIKDARIAFKDAEEKTGASSGSMAVVTRAFQLLLALGTLQVYKQEADSVGVLEDITTCYQSPVESEESSAMLVELLLSFVSRPSALYRRLAEQVFAAFAPDITAEGLQSMIDVLSQKESLAGQRELFKGDEEDAEADRSENEEEENDGDDVEMEDVEDASDVEIVNGEVVKGDDSDSDSDSSSEVDADEDDEEAEFDRKLADALGTAGLESDSDESDMDDDQMMELEPHLNNIFKERKKTSTTKQDHKGAKENIVNFKNRVLDLLLVYVKTQHSNPLALNLLHPLTTLARTTSNQPTAQKAYDALETYFDSSKKNKTLPQVQDSEGLLGILRAIHSEIRLGGSKIHARACSRSGLFLSRLLMSMDEEKHLPTVAHMYLELQIEKKLRKNPRISKDVLLEWNNWLSQS